MIGFIRAVFSPSVYGAYALLWTCGLESSAMLLAGQTWRPTADTAVRAFSVLLALLFLRIVDEQKDLDYDRVHHPGRPLVTGAVTVRELRTSMVLIVIGLVALNLRQPAALAVLIAVLGYALLLQVAEQRSRRLRTGLFLNLAVTHPVQVLISVYLYQCTGLPWRAESVALLAIFACVFLHFEFARKTAWDAAPDSRLYSGPLGPLGSAGVAVAWAVSAAALTADLFPPWRLGSTAVLPYLGLVLPVAGLVLFWRRRPAAWPVPLGMAFVVTTYLSLTLQAATA